MTPRLLACSVFAIATGLSEMAYAAIDETCMWRGTAPFCEGHCESGELTRAASTDGKNAPDYPGFGATCISGVKSYCCKPLFPSGPAGGPPPPLPGAPEPAPTGVETRRGGDVIVAPGPVPETKVNKGPIVDPEKVISTAGFEGAWSATADNVAYDIVMGQTGDTVIGTFVGADGSRGQFSGAVNGKVLRFSWSQLDGARGSGKFTLSNDGQSFAGSYNFGQNPDEVVGTWNGSRR